WSSKIKGRPGVKVIVQNAKVLSAERQTAEQVKPGAPIPSTVTLLVVAKDAAKIQLASTTGSLSLSLRGDTDNIGTAVDEITINDLLDATEGDDPDSRKTGTVLIDGKKFIVVPGKGMIPAGN
ncbi:MAG: hypothetical protein KDD42_04545, partial [Bdellovibrionales bacterium]|nr:hypothetical protein [Bdellovibrionales bacterium]